MSLLGWVRADNVASGGLLRIIVKPKAVPVDENNLCVNLHSVVKGKSFCRTADGWRAVAKPEDEMGFFIQRSGRLWALFRSEDVTDKPSSLA